MEATLKKHIAEGNWEAIHYLYDDAPEELRLQYAYPFGKAYLQSKFKNGIHTATEVEKLSEAFRISLYDHRMIKDIWKIAGSELIHLIDKLEQKAREHIAQSGAGDPGWATHSKIGAGYYLLSFYLYSDRQLALRRTSKAAVFLLETFAATHIKNTCSKKASWNSLLDMLVRMKVLSPEFIPAIIAFLRLYNSFNPNEKLTQLWFMDFVVKNEDRFSDQDNARLKDFIEELRAESLLYLLQQASGVKEDKKKSEEERIRRAEELKQFAIDYADCPEDLGHIYFTETSIYIKVQTYLDDALPEKAFELIQKSFPEGLPEHAALIRPLFTRTVTELFEAGQIEFVVKALKMDPTNDDLKDLLLT